MHDVARFIHTSHHCPGQLDYSRTASVGCGTERKPLHRTSKDMKSETSPVAAPACSTGLRESRCTPVTTQSIARVCFWKGLNVFVFTLLFVSTYLLPLLICSCKATVWVHRRNCGVRGQHTSCCHGDWAA